MLISERGNKLRVRPEQQKLNYATVNELRALLGRPLCQIGHKSPVKYLFVASPPGKVPTVCSLYGSSLIQALGLCSESPFRRGFPTTGRNPRVDPAEHE